MATSAAEWVERYAAALGVEPPSPEELRKLLRLAGTAAHASERTAAPISCWLAARSGLPAGEAVAAALQLAGAVEGPPEGAGEAQEAGRSRSGQE